MKKIFLLLLATAAFTGARAQTGISAAGTAADAAAMLDVIATDKGFMVPRVALTALNTAGPVTGLSATSTSLLVYNTATAGTAPNDVTPGFYYWNNATTSWIRILSGSANPVAGNDIDFGTSASGSIDVEPILNFVHTINAPAANNLNLIPPAGFKVTVNNLNPGTTGLNEVFSVYNGAGGASPTFYLTPSGRAIANDWYYSSGNTGWFNSAWGGGWYMNDATAIKSYGSKDVRILDNTTTLVVDGLTTGGTYNTAAGANTNIMYVNNSTGKVYSLPASNNSVLSTNGSGVPAWTSPASLGVKWNALIDPDGALSLSHGTNATVFNFAHTTTTGFAMNATAQTTGNLLSLNSTNANSTGNALLVSSNSTGASANGIVRYNFTGAHTNNGFQIDDATTTGTAMAANATALTTGKALSITAGGATALTTGNALLVTGPSGAAVLSNAAGGVVNFTAAGNYTSTNNAGLLNLNANATTAGIIQNISGNALTTGTALNITSTGAYTGANGIFAVTANSATTGTVAKITSNGLTTGTALDISSASTAGNNSKLLNLTRSGTNGAPAMTKYSQRNQYCRLL